MQQQPHKPTTPPTPEDPRPKTPMQDPPVQPEHDDRGDKTKIAGSPGKQPPPRSISVPGKEKEWSEEELTEAERKERQRPR